MNQLNRIFDILNDSESNSELNTKLDSYQNKENEASNGSRCNSMSSMRMLSGTVGNTSTYNLRGRLLNTETNNHLDGFCVRAKIIQSQSDDIDLGNKITNQKGAFAFKYSKISNPGYSLRVRFTVMTLDGQEITTRLSKVEINQNLLSYTLKNLKHQHLQLMLT